MQMPPSVSQSMPACSGFESAEREPGPQGPLVRTDLVCLVGRVEVRRAMVSIAV